MKKEDITIYSNIFYRCIIPFIVEPLWENMDKEKEENKKVIKRIGNYMKYSLFRWYVVEKKMKTCYKVIECKNLGYFIKFGEIKEYDIPEKEGRSPSKKQDTKWKLNYNELYEEVRGGLN